jgi:starch-binding outer membrane protein, SusD/RagB family
MSPFIDFTSRMGRSTRGLMRFTFRRSVFAVVAATASLVGCQNELTLPNYNSPTVSGLSGDPSGLQLAATGILVSERNNYNGYIIDVSLFGREGYYYFQTDARYVTDYLVGAGTGTNRSLSPTGFASSSNRWFNYFRNERNTVNLVNASEASSMTDQQKAAVRGFANTFRALDMYYTISLRDSLGMPVEIRPNPNDQPPFVSRDSAYKSISALLDAAKTDLTAAGATAFPFSLHSGFNGFDTPATFLKFNRAVAARVLAMRGSLDCGNACYTQALAAVSESFATAAGAAATVADLNAGVYNIYSTAPGDVLNGLNYTQDANELAHASIVTDAQKQADGTTLDARVTRKVAALAAPVASPGKDAGIPATYRFQIYATNTTPTPIIRNEELILIRAEANIKLGNVGPALIDLNNIRAVSGNLPPLAGVPTIDNLIYERRASLLLEGFRWIDARRFGKLSTLPLDLPTHFVAKVVPIPKAECDARLVKPNGC